MIKSILKLLAIGAVGMLHVGGLAATASAAGQITLAWDANEPAPDGYRLFQRTEGQSYNYGSPIVIDGVTDANGNIPADVQQVTISDVGIADGTLETVYWVIRAFVAEDESGDSNEVSHVFDFAPPAAVANLQATFDRAASSINMSFDAAADPAVTSWKIFYTTTSGADYIEFDTIQNSGQTTVNVTKPFTAVPEGQRQNIYWVVVAYKGTQYSPNSEEVVVDVDRRVATPPSLRIEAVIPVQ
jgi:hypothetical protein